MTREELQVKFDSLASPSFSDVRREKIRRLVYHLDELEKVGELLGLCVMDR